MPTSNDKLWKQVKNWLNEGGVETDDDDRATVMEEVEDALTEKNGYAAAKVLDKTYDWEPDAALVAMLDPHCEPSDG